MKIIIFAGGIGTRLWPLSRKNSPKQFDKIFNGKSTLELAIERVEPFVGLNNIFVQTTSEFADAARAQISALPAENIFIEPSRRNVGPAVCYGMMRLNTNLHETEHESTRIKKLESDCDPIAILWADHLMEHTEEFRDALKLGEKLINENSERFIFLAERPRFANNNLGWINVGEKEGEIEGNDYFKFLGWKYRPESEECDQMFKDGNYFWNPGYFISSIDFILSQYENLVPEIYENVKNAVENPEDSIEYYEKCEKVSFDRAVIEKTDLSKAVVIKTNMGWSDPGTLYALKEALEKSKEDNVVKGNVVSLNTKDSLLYNFDKKKLLTAVGLDGFVVVNTDDAIIIVPKDEVVNVTKLVEKIGEEGYGEYL